MIPGISNFINAYRPIMQAQVKIHGFKDEADLDETIKEITQWIERTKARESGVEPEEKVCASRIGEPAVYSW
jgi:hypothetical protein